MTATKTVLASLALFTLGSLACAPGPVEPWDTNLRDGIAVGGYDVVAYFDGEAVPGDDAISTEWDGVTWLFADEQSRAVFEEDPEAYAPRYGGWCAWSMRWNQIVDSKPGHFSIDDGELYLFNNEDARRKWARDPARYRRIADRNWAEIELLP
ncbi:MAG: YHS domain-containing (seleno)protein [Myxococcota bacterium]